jgi:hypothetical protein
MVERRRAQRSLVRTREAAPAATGVQPDFDSLTSSEVPPSKAEVRRKSNGPLPLIIVNGLLLAMCGYAALSATLPTKKTASRNFFGLNVAHTNTGLRLLWNASATGLRGVTEAELTIADGQHRSQLLLSPGQIRSGNLFYVPFTGEVRFDLRVQNGDHVTNETVLALDQPSSSRSVLQKANEPTTLPGAVTFPAGAPPELMSNLTAAKPRPVQ